MNIDRSHVNAAVFLDLKKKLLTPLTMMYCWRNYITMVYAVPVTTALLRI